MASTVAPSKNKTVITSVSSFCAHSPMLVRMPNWLGDVVMALPALLALKQVGFDLCLLGKSWLRDLLGNDDFEIKTYPSQSLQAIRTLRDVNMQAYLLLTNSLSSAMAGYLAGKKTYGYFADWRRMWLSAGLRKQPGYHEVEYFWRMAKFAVQQSGSSAQLARWPLWLPHQVRLPSSVLSWVHHAPAADDPAAELLSRVGVVGPYWVVCPTAAGCSKQKVTKIWPGWLSFFQQMLTTTTPSPFQSVTLIACPTPEEYVWIQANFPDTLLCVPNVNLKDYMRILAGAQLVIGNDTGPLHLAAALRTPVLGIYGATDPCRTAPWGGHYVGALNQWPSVDEVMLAVQNLPVNG